MVCRSKVPVFAKDPARFLRRLLRPQKVPAAMQLLDWHLQAARQRRYDLEPLMAARHAQITNALGYLLGEKQVQLCLLSARDSHVSCWDTENTLITLWEELMVFFWPQPRYERYQFSQLVQENLEAIFTKPLATVFTGNWPAKCKRRGDGLTPLAQTIFLDNLQSLAAHVITAISLDEHKGTMNLLTHLLDGTRSCLILGHEAKDDTKWYAITA